MAWGKSALLTIPLLLSGIIVVASPASAYRVGDEYSDWASASVGGAHACAVRSGRVYCWGKDDRGQRGDGNGAATGVDNTPNRVGDDDNWTAVSAGTSHTCGIRGGKIYCWGDNSQGQLGNGGDGNLKTTPDQIGSNATWRAVSAGGAHTCAIRNDYIIACWGNDSKGQLGNGAAGSRNVPVLVSAARWKSISAGGAHSCGVRTDGMIACWGDDSEGQVGNGASPSTSSPAKISNGAWHSVSAGGAHSCAIRSDRLLACWGNNASGQVGNGTAIDQPRPVQIDARKDWKSVAAGGAHSCGIRGTGALYCWGDNTYGQITGAASASPRTRPLRIYSSVADYRTADAGQRLSCGIRVGRLYCWGGIMPTNYPPAGSTAPGAVPGFDLSYWKLTVPADNVASPVDDNSDADEIKYGGTPDLATFSAPAYFHSNGAAASGVSANQGVYFRARADGATTSNSSYARSELREMSSTYQNAGWTNKTSTHTMTIRQAITHLPDVKPDVVAGQIHDGANDVLQIRLEGTQLRVTVAGYSGKVLDSSYPIRAMFDLVIRADPSGLTVEYDRGSVSSSYFAPKVGSSTSKWYFKAGCYTQSNADKGDLPEAYGEVLIDSLDISPVS